MMVSQTQKELKPCPLCGSRAVQTYRPKGGRLMAVCMELDCGCSAPTMMWNRRAPLDNVTS